MPEADNKEAKQFHEDVPQETPGFFLKGCGQYDWGMKSRMARVFNPESGRTVMLAVDHGYFQGPTTGLERIDLNIVPLMPQCDALFCTRGILRSVVPADSRKPVVLLTNEVTLSDGEMTANGFKALKRGPIVGNTTYGWLIFTTSRRVMNGASFRLPFWGCYTLDGQDLETGGGVTPDIEVINTLADDLQGGDPQLDKAVEVIMQRLK